MQFHAVCRGNLFKIQGSYGYRDRKVTDENGGEAEPHMEFCSPEITLRRSTASLFLIKNR